MAATTKVNLLQTATNAAATVVAACVEAKLIKSLEEVANEFAGTRDSIYASLLKEHTEEEQQEEKQRTDPGNVALNFGKHKGKTIAQVQKSDPTWLDWVLKNSDNDWIKERINAFREGREITGQ